jgi:hypothetical protein
MVTIWDFKLEGTFPGAVEECGSGFLGKAGRGGAEDAGVEKGSA